MPRRTSICQFLLLFAVFGSSSGYLPMLRADDGKTEDKKAKASELVTEGQNLLSQRKAGQAAKLFQQATELDPKNATAWHLHGYSLHVLGKLDEAIQSHRKAAGFPQTKVVALYNLACAYSLKNEKAAALKFLEKAIDANFAQLDFLETDKDLNNIRDEKKFEQLVARVKNGGRAESATDTKAKAKPTDDQFNRKKFKGTWKVIEGERSGQKVDASRLPPAIEVTEKELTIPTGDGNPFKFSYKIDSSKSPAHIDFEITGGPVPQGKALGIIKIEKGIVTLCYDSKGEKRPEKFETSEGDGRFLFKLKMAEQK